MFKTRCFIDLGCFKQLSRMFFVATLQPIPTKKEENDGFFTTLEKRQVIDKFYKSRDTKDLPICIEHGTGEQYGYVVEQDKTAGKVLDLFNDEEGNIVAKCLLFGENEHFKVIIDAIENEKEKWGVSQWIDIFRETMEPDCPVEKELTHVALTSDPYFADRNTFIHHWSYKEDALDKVIAKEYYTKDKGECYASNEYIEKLEASIATTIQESEPEPQMVEEKQEISTNTEEEPASVIVETAATTTTTVKDPEPEQQMEVEKQEPVEVVVTTEEPSSSVQMEIDAKPEPESLESPPNSTIQLVKGIDPFIYHLAASRMILY
jgi:hypothetical protein